MTRRDRLMTTLRESLIRSAHTVRWLVSIMVPASAAVLILRLTGLLSWISGLLEPAMGLLGLPGSASIALLSGAFINLYPVIAIASEIDLTQTQLIVIALFSLIAHNLPVEVMVTRRTGTPVPRMLALRLGGATVVAFVVSRLHPLITGAETGGAPVGPGGATGAGGAAGASAGGLGLEAIFDEVLAWAGSTVSTTARIAAVVVVLLVATRVLNEFGVMTWIAHHLRAVTWLFGLPTASGAPWIVANTLGLAYGAAVLTEEAETGRLSAADGDLLNHHLGISHSILEDTLLFVAIGAPIGWVILPRLVAAFIAVWERRVERLLGWVGHTEARLPRA